MWTSYIASKRTLLLSRTILGFHPIWLRFSDSFPAPPVRPAAQVLHAVQDRLAEVRTRHSVRPGRASGAARLLRAERVRREVVRLELVQRPAEVKVVVGVSVIT